MAVEMVSPSVSGSLRVLFLGAMTLSEALRSLALFATEVMPRLARL